MSAAEKTFAQEIAALVVAELRGQGISGVYTSKHLPPGCASRQAFNDRCRFIEGAYRDGKVWVCPVAAYEAAMRRGARAKPRERKVERPEFDRIGALIKVARTPKPQPKGR